MQADVSDELQLVAARGAVVHGGNFEQPVPEPGPVCGWSNAGLVVDGEESLLVDTLFDLHLTRDMLAAMREAERIVVNVATLYREFGSAEPSSDLPELFALMARIRRERAGR